MPFFLPAIGALVGGVTNAISGAQNADQYNQNIDIAQNTLKSDMIGDKGLNDLLLANNRFYTGQLSNIMNSTAISSKGVLNSGVVGGAVAGGMVGKEGEADLQIRENANKQNMSLTDRIAQLQTMRKSDSVLSDFFTGAVGGLTAGLAANKDIAATDAITANPTSINTTNPTAKIAGAFTPPSISGLSNPYSSITSNTSFKNPLYNYALNPDTSGLGVVNNPSYAPFNYR